MVQVLQGYPAKRWGELEFGCKRSDSEAYTIKSMPNCLYDFLEKNSGWYRPKTHKSTIKHLGVNTIV